MRTIRTALFSFALLAFSMSTCAAEALLLFGGKDHKTFLGCLNCGPVDSNSVCNAVSDYGSVVGDNSIWNVVGDYGSVVSDESPWNAVASYPPVIVDKNGGFYGYFTANVAQSKRTNISTLVRILDSNDTGDIKRKMLCGD